MSCDTKDAAAEGALSLVRDLIKSSGGLIGIGTGSTVARLLPKVVELLKGKRVLSSSLSTASLLASMGIDVISYPASYPPVIEVYIDGADEVSPDGNMIKGGGGALLGEKILAYSSELNVFVVGEEKLSDLLGTRRPVPIEVVPESYPYVLSSLKALRLNASARQSNGKMGPTVSDWRGIIVDVYTGPIKDPRSLEATLRSIPGVVETGLFIGYADYIVVGRRACSYDILSFRRSAKAPYI